VTPVIVKEKATTNCIASLQEHWLRTGPPQALAACLLQCTCVHTIAPRVAFCYMTFTLRSMLVPMASQTQPATRHNL
jgi:hypothetical protein